MSPIEVSEETFNQEVLERSKSVPVVVDFWAAWCGPCRFLGPVLEKLAAEANGSWVLAKVDVDANPYLANGFGIQGIPAVKAFKGRREVAEFVGALPEPQVRSWLAQLGPGEAETALAQARRLEDEGRVEDAIDGYQQALAADPKLTEARSALARLRLAGRAGDIEALRSRVAENPPDLPAVINFADALAATQEFSEAFDLLLDFIRRASGDERDEARKHLLELLDALPVDDARARNARRSLAAALF